jgi:pimeloyl-ACP methyl ester carboxylesterase
MPGREAVLMLHGFLMNRFVMHPLQGALRDAGFDAHALDYRSIRGTLAEHHEECARAIDGLIAQGAARVHLLGHSMGGVVALSYLLRQPAPEHIGRTVLLGSPVAGCDAATLFSQQALGRLLMGNSASLWREAMPLLIPPDREVAAIAGNERFGLGPLVVELEGENDGVARVVETWLTGMADHILLPVSHTGMLLSAEVARQCIAFLRNGRFAR